jgi:hypothetical protein
MKIDKSEVHFVTTMDLTGLKPVKKGGKLKMSEEENIPETEEVEETSEPEKEVPKIGFDDLKANVVERLIYNFDLKEATADNVSEKLPSISPDAWKTLKRGVRWMVSHANPEIADDLYIEDEEFDQVLADLEISVA